MLWFTNSFQVPDLFYSALAWKQNLLNATSNCKCVKIFASCWKGQPLMQAFLSWVFVLSQNLYTENIVNLSGLFLKSVLSSTNDPAQLWLFINSQNSEPWCPGDLWYLASKLPVMHPTILHGIFLHRDRTGKYQFFLFSWMYLSRWLANLLLPEEMDKHRVLTIFIFK